MDSYGFSGICVKWFKSYLSNRLQYVDLNGVQSEKKENKSWGATGLNIWPILFSHTYQWLLVNKLILNMIKTVYIKIMNKTTSIFPLTNDNLVLPLQTSVKNLGVILDSKLRFHWHISELYLKLGRQCGLVAQMRQYVPKDPLVRYYNWNIRSLIQYGLLVYECCSLKALSEFLINQLKILKLMFFQKSGENIGALYWEKSNTNGRSFFHFWAFKIRVRFSLQDGCKTLS